jgi:hypothetical protein
MTDLFMKAAFTRESQIAMRRSLSNTMAVFIEETSKITEHVDMDSFPPIKSSTKDTGKTIYPMEKRERSIALHLSSKVPLLMELRKDMGSTNGA